jgi:hypothetical protein
MMMMMDDDGDGAAGQDETARHGLAGGGNTRLSAVVGLCVCMCDWFVVM